MKRQRLPILLAAVGLLAAGTGIGIAIGRSTSSSTAAPATTDVTADTTASSPTDASVADTATTSDEPDTSNPHSTDDSTNDSSDDSVTVDSGATRTSDTSTAPTPAPSLSGGPRALPPGDLAESIIDIRPDDPATVPAPSEDGSGNFRIGCNYSHMSNDDPIVFPGQPGKAHLHTFFGNTLTDANSTYDSLRDSGDGTCDGGIANRSAYWVPSLIGADGVALQPDLGFIYYKSGVSVQKWPDPTNHIEHIPNGLKIIAGNAKATTAQNEQVGGFYCEADPGASETQHIPDCAPGDELTLEVIFPQCWDGKNLDSPDHHSHMSYPVYDEGCDAAHPVALPAITVHSRWLVPASGTKGMRLSSDADGDPGGMSFHADVMEAWTPKVRDLFTDDCIVAHRDCGGPNGPNLGDGTILWFYTAFGDDASGASAGDSTDDTASGS